MILDTFKTVISPNQLLAHPPNITNLLSLLSKNIDAFSLAFGLFYDAFYITYPLLSTTSSNYIAYHYILFISNTYD